MMVAKGILTSRGGLVSHAAVVARGWGTPAIVGAESVHIDGKKFTVGDTVVREGDDALIGQANQDGFDAGARNTKNAAQTVFSQASPRG
jgi:phosphoenolpyruvate synthase/pyruvate phosphate dikinase